MVPVNTIALPCKLPEALVSLLLQCGITFVHLTRKIIVISISAESPWFHRDIRYHIKAVDCVEYTSLWSGKLLRSQRGCECVAVHILRFHRRPVHKHPPCEIRNCTASAEACDPYPCITAYSVIFHICFHAVWYFRCRTWKSLVEFTVAAAADLSVAVPFATIVRTSHCHGNDRSRTSVYRDFFMCDGISSFIRGIRKRFILVVCFVSFVEFQCVFQKTFCIAVVPHIFASALFLLHRGHCKSQRNLA